MSTKTHFIKTILTTASTLALAIGGAHNTLADPTTRTTDGNVSIASGEGFADNTFNDGDAIALGNAGDNINIDAKKIISSFDSGNLTPTGTVTVSSAGSGASLTGVFGAHPINLTLENNVTNFKLSHAYGTGDNPSPREFGSIHIGDNSSLFFDSTNDGMPTMGGTFSAGTNSTLALKGAYLFQNSIGSYDNKFNKIILEDGTVFAIGGANPFANTNLSLT